MKKEDITLIDQITGKELKGTIHIDNNGVYFSFDGYGEANAQPGFGSPVFIEFYGNELRVICWNDINEQEPTIVSMEDAKESKR